MIIAIIGLIFLGAMCIAANLDNDDEWPME